MIVLFAIILTAIFYLAYLAFLGLAAFAVLWFGWQALTKGYIPTSSSVQPKVSKTK